RRHITDEQPGHLGRGLVAEVTVAIAAILDGGTNREGGPQSDHRAKSSNAAVADGHLASANQRPNIELVAAAEVARLRGTARVRRLFVAGQHSYRDLVPWPQVTTQILDFAVANLADADMQVYSLYRPVRHRVRSERYRTHFFADESELAINANLKSRHRTPSQFNAITNSTHSQLSQGTLKIAW